ncbi:MAG TPA: hypothetical protein VIY47_02840 [Ignavibacteriaceae bacterium]
MSNFELIDDYLTHRLNEQERTSFEQQMTSDPALKADVELQKQIIEGLKSARAAELKAMLNQVPVSAFKFSLSPGRIAAGLIGTVVLATGAYFYFNQKDGLEPTPFPSSQVDSMTQSETNPAEIEEDNAVIEELQNSAKPAYEQENSTPRQQDTDPIKNNTKQESKPVIDLVDPTEDLTDNEPSPVKSGVNNTTISVAKINVDVISTERKYKTHYQFANGKLMLYGNFDKGLYEIIEVNGQHSRSLFLYYKTAYYLLDENKHEITLLKEISDPVLKEKLKTFRSN